MIRTFLPKGFSQRRNSFTAIIISLLMLYSVNGYSQIINTIAGTGQAGFSGDGNSALKAQFSSGMVYITLDKKGNIYVADGDKDCIRKIDVNGIVTTVAGNPSLGRGYNGDNIPATSAMLSRPNCVAFDDKGNMYIADDFNSRIRMVDSKGIIHTIAGTGEEHYSGDGGPASQATLNEPTFITFDKSGNLFIADCDNHVIRKIDKNNIITTVAGNGDGDRNWMGGTYSGDGGNALKAGLNSPTSIAFDSKSNLYISDLANNRIRMVTPAGIINTIAGNGNSFYNGDNLLAAQTHLNHPSCIYVDQDDNLFLSDGGNNLIRAIKNSVITTIAGDYNRGGSFSGDGGLAINAGLSNPSAFTLDDAGNIYIVDINNARIRKVTLPCTINKVGNDTAMAVCPGETVNLTKIYNVAAYISSIWNISNPSSAGTGIDSLIVSNQKGCKDTVVATITLKPKPDLGADRNIAICNGSTFDLNTLFNTSSYPKIIWNIPDFRNATAGVDSLIVANIQGCGDTAIVTITANPAITSHIDTAICKGKTYAGYSIGGSYTDRFSSNLANGCDSIRTLNLTIYPTFSITLDTTICYGQNIFGHSATGTYTSMLKTLRGCDSIQTLNLTVMPLPKPHLVADTSICLGDGVMLSPGIFDSYVWQDGSTNKSYMVTNAGNFTVTVSNHCGTATATTIVKTTACNIAFPSAFSPNGDGINDKFRALNAYGVSNFDIVIFNRWGQKIFETKDALTGWDGTFNGAAVPIGIYMYVCRFNKAVSQTKATLSGTITLLR